MIQEPKKRSNGRPTCKEEIEYIIKVSGGELKRSQIREKLVAMGYGSHCILGAYKTLERTGKIEYEGSSHSGNQIVRLKSFR